jgi:hypothetical protein
VADAVLVLPGWTTSKGTKNELKTAMDLRIPIFYTFGHSEEKINKAIGQMKTFFMAA